MLNVIPWMSQSCEIKSIIEVFDGVGDRFILTDLVIIYTRYGSSQPQLLLPDYENLGHHTKTFTEKGVNLFIKYLLRRILCRFLLPQRLSSLGIKANLTSIRLAFSPKRQCFCSPIVK